MKPTPSMAVAVTALVVALGGTATGASHLLSGSKIKKNSIPANRLKKDSVTGTQIKEAKLGTVPSAVNAIHATTADSAAHATSADRAGGAPPTGAAGGALAGSYPNPALAPAEPWHEVGDPGEPPFRSSCANYGNGDETVGFYKDPVGIVHLKGGFHCTAGAAGNVVFQLPAGYRPASGVTLILPIACICKVGSTPVDTGQIAIRGSGFDSNGNGAVSVLTFEATAGVSPLFFDGVTFRADS
jgi:hypothetical protein